MVGKECENCSGSGICVALSGQLEFLKEVSSLTTDWYCSYCNKFGNGRIYAGWWTCNKCGSWCYGTMRGCGHAIIEGSYEEVSHNCALCSGNGNFACIHGQIDKHEYCEHEKCIQHDD